MLNAPLASFSQCMFDVLIHPLHGLLCGILSRMRPFVCLMGLQGWFLLHQLPAGGPWRPTHALGLSMWAAGWLCNIHSDAVLRGLRSRAGDAGETLMEMALFSGIQQQQQLALECACVVLIFCTNGQHVFWQLINCLASSAALAPANFSWQLAS